jgi:hypothetical protein
MKIIQCFCLTAIVIGGYFSARIEAGPASASNRLERFQVFLTNRSSISNILFSRTSLLPPPLGGITTRFHARRSGNDFYIQAITNDTQAGLPIYSGLFAGRHNNSLWEITGATLTLVPPEEIRSTNYVAELNQTGLSFLTTAEAFGISHADPDTLEFMGMEFKGKSRNGRDLKGRVTRWETATAEIQYQVEGMQTSFFRIIYAFLGNNGDLFPVEFSTEMVRTNGVAPIDKIIVQTAVKSEDLDPELLYPSRFLIGVKRVMLVYSNSFIYHVKPTGLVPVSGQKIPKRINLFHFAVVAIIASPLFFLIRRRIKT